MMLRLRTGAALLAALTLSAMGAACARPVMLAPSAPLTPAVTSQARKSLNAPRAIPADYYAGAEGLAGDSLLRALNQRVKGQTDLGYDGGRDILFDNVDDPTDTNTIVSVYTGEVITGVSTRSSAYNKGFNTEHTWPQSKGATGAGKGDVHHLYACDIDSNGLRSSHPFGVVVNAAKILPDLSFPGQSSKLGFNAGGTEVFEPPTRHKGNVARALMYFYTRYAAARGSASLENFTVERQVLQQWHQMDPVDDAERLRNDRIFAVQKNRNPFIDRPEFAERIGGAFLPGSR
jgi:endonuclease I